MAASVASPLEARIERRELKRWGFKLRGVFGALIIGTFAVLAVLSPPAIAEGTWAAVACDTLGWAIFLAGACFRFWSTLYIGGRKTQTVVCEGPYSFCRNPLYVGTFLLWLAVAVFLKSATLVAGVGLGVVFYWFVTIPAEERVLRSMLGQPYDDYCRRVPRLWPRWSLFHTSPTIQVNVHSLATEGRRAIRWVGLPILAALLAHLRNQGGWPQWFHLPQAPSGMTVLASPIVEAAGERPKVRKQWAERRRATIAFAILTPFAVAAVFSPPAVVRTSLAGIALETVAYLFFVMGAACRFWATLYIGGRKGRHVVREGPYSMMRNPLYLGTFLLALSAIVFLQDLRLMVGFAIAAVTYVTVTIPSEERRLASKLDEDYQQYCREVPRFIPQPRLFATSASITVDWHCLATEARRALRWIWIPIAGELLTVLRTAPWWPTF